MLRANAWSWFEAGCLLVAALSAPVQAACSAQEADTDKDGKPDAVVLENEFLKLTFNKALGGVAYSVIYKPTNAELAVKGQPSKDGFFQAILGDVTGEDSKWDTRDVPEYLAEVARNEPNEAAVKVTFPLPLTRSEPAYHQTALTRTFALKTGVPVVFCDIEFVNSSAKTLPFTLQVAHQCWLFGKECWHFVPDSFGVRYGWDDAINHTSHPVGTQDPVAAWSAFMGVPDKIGLAFNFEWKYLDAIENWLSGKAGATIQWPYRRQQVAPGKSWKTSYAIFPIVGMDSVDGSGNLAAGGIVTGTLGGVDKATDRVRGKQVKVFVDFTSVLGSPGAGDEAKVGAALPVKVYLTAGVPKKVTVEYLTRLLPGPFQSVETREAQVEPLKSTVLDYAYTPPQTGTHLLRFVVREGKNVLFAMERPLTIGESEQMYFAEKPAEPQEGEVFIGATIIDPALPEWNYNLDLSLVTPHVPWGKPWCKGKAGVLFVSRNENTVAYWRELYERGDLALDHTVVAHRAGTKYPYTQPTLRKLAEKIAEGGFDTLFFAWVHWEKGFPAVARNQVFSAIRSGKGAVIMADISADAKRDEQSKMCADLARFLATGKELDASQLTGAISSRFGKQVIPQMCPVRLFEVGKGRVCVIEAYSASVYETLTPALGQWQIQDAPKIPAWEYGLGLLLRGIYWAAKQESPLVVTQADADAEKIVLQVTNTSPETVRAVVAGTAKNHLYEPEMEFQQAKMFAPGTNQVVVRWQAKLSDRLHVAEVILRDPEGRSLGWATSFFEVERPVSVRAAMDRETSLYRENERPGAVVKLIKKGTALPRLTLELAARDAWGRLVWEDSRSVVPEAETTEMRFDLTPMLARRRDILHDLTATLKSYREGWSKDQHTFYLAPERMPLYDDFYAAMWGGFGPDPIKIQITARQAIQGAGIDYSYAYDYGKPARELAYRNHGLLLGPPGSVAFRTGAYATDEKGNLIERKNNKEALTWDPPLVPTPEQEAAFRKRYADLAKGYGDWGGIDYLHMDDERHMGGDFDWSEPTIVKFRDWLRGRYADLAALNRQWETTYAAWDEVMPARRDKLQEANKGNNLSQWLDWRLFTGWAIDTYYVQVPAEAAREGNPRACVGQHGIYTPTSGMPHDFWQMSRWMTVTGRYNSMEEEWFLSFNPDCIHGQYGGYGIDQLTQGKRFHPWRNLFHGSHWCFFYMMWNAGLYNQGILEGDQSVHYGYATQAEEEWPDLKGGVGKLFIETRFTHDGIAFPYSQSSLILDGDHQGDLYNQKTIVQELGFQHWSVPYERLEQGYLVKECFKLLLLPRTECLSSKEADGIREFVHRGGVLVADVHAALRDEHGRRLEQGKGALDNVFGIDRSGVAYEPRELKVSFGESAPQGLRGRSLPITVPEQGLKLTGGKAWGTTAEGIPVCVESKFGKGRTLYFNLDFGAYGSSKGAGVRGEVIVESRGAEDFVSAVQDLFRAAFDLAGLKRRVTVLAKADGKPLGQGETFYFQSPGEQALYVGTMFLCEESTPVEVVFDRDAHLYDVRDRTYHGCGRRFDDVFHPGRAQVYAALPYRVAGVDVALLDRSSEARVFVQGDTVMVKSRLVPDKGKAGLHVLRFQVFSPDGKECKAYAINLRAEGGVAERSIPLALDEPPGTYRVLVTDIASRVQAAAHFDVAPRREAVKAR
jgi:hypothetical protein